MAEPRIEDRFRYFLLGMTAVILAGTLFELVLVEHYEHTLQWIPLILGGLGLISVALAWALPAGWSMKILRWVMLLVALGSLVGVYLHFDANLAFVHEIHPEYSSMQAIWPAMKGGDPLVAPGILYLAGMMGLASTYKHPALNDS